MRFAAIDIGSNAVRLLLSRVIQQGDNPFIKKEALLRMPIRLGEDSFTSGRISDLKVRQLVSTMQGFKHLMDAYQPIAYMACATSAMREAENGPEIVQSVREQAEIELVIIKGDKEADIIYANHFEEKLDRDKSYLYIDVGGGSTELTVFANHQSITSNSFNIGTIRILHGLVKKHAWEEMKRWLKGVAPEFQPITGIGSGGNINKMFRLSGLKEGKPITRKRLNKLHAYLQTFSLDERIKIFGMRPDRADVIVPAGQIFTSVMKWASIEELYVPEIGLADGIIRMLYDKHADLAPERPAAQS